MACPAGFTFDTFSHKGSFAACTETLQPGERVMFYDNDIVWSTKHFPASRLEPLRQVGDVLADNALEALKIKPGQDAYSALLEYTSRPESEQKSPAPRLLMEQLMTVPEWVNWEQVRRGQQVYWRYCLFISHALLHFSLTGGFAIPKVTKVLNSTGYLFGKRTKERVYETSQFVVDVAHSLEYLQPGTGVGWAAIIQVRFLHAGVRARLSRMSRAHSKYYNIEEHGVPINQEDMLGTLFSFSNTMWRVMELKMGVSMTYQEREDFMHLWRYVGYMLGVDDVLGATRSPELADACLESIFLHLVTPDEESGRICTTFLKNMSPEPVTWSKAITAIGVPDPFKIHMALAERLLGVDFWRVTGLPSMTRRYRYVTKAIMFLLLLDLWLITKVPGWFGVRNSMIRKAQAWWIAMYIGKKRSKFVLKVMPKESPQDWSDASSNQVVSKSTEKSLVRGRVWPMVLTAGSAAIGMTFLRRSGRSRARMLRFI
ncbi:hypothetical protein BC939DRAFT_103022 [Gamsiella multidivaricata]|uniref:uncharacterized protein n=1 Tax=Gamsiella multidivaricata TaxID=101098 RepID=UPI00221EF093|nr:uncharacterized protein BC939DRAFT_103022 [Gamsiella multidivaricata]KAG0370302.1 hypothetical protein BGZ54_006988 [Gamsiella multidivaricata]KAI7832404.1 hypothetical protein BC939DRAFT_103022 [Gamsiella multidivaricata]